MRYQVEAELPIDAQSYFIERDSGAFRSLLARSLNLGRYEFVESWKEGNVKYVKLLTKPDFSSWVPKSAMSALPSKNIEFYDIIKYDPQELRSPPYRLHVQSQIPFLGEKTDIWSTLTIAQVAPNVTRQTLQGKVKIKVFGVGKIAERMVKGNLEKTYARLPELVHRWVEFRQQMLGQPGGEERLMHGVPSMPVPWVKEEIKNRKEAINGSKREQAKEGERADENDKEKHGQHKADQPEPPSTPLQTRDSRVQHAQQAKQALLSDNSPRSSSSDNTAAPQQQDTRARQTQRHGLQDSATGHPGPPGRQQAQRQAQQQAQQQATAASRPRKRRPKQAPLPPLALARQPTEPLPTPFALVAKQAASEAPPPTHSRANQSRDWSHFNQESEEWREYWEHAGVQPLPGAHPVPPGVLRLGSFTYKLGLLRPSQAATHLHQAADVARAAQHPPAAAARNGGPHGTQALAGVVQQGQAQDKPEIVPADEAAMGGQGCVPPTGGVEAGKGKGAACTAGPGMLQDSRVSRESGACSVLRSSQEYDGSTRAQRGSVGGPPGSSVSEAEGIQGGGDTARDGLQDEGGSSSKGGKGMGWGRVKRCLCLS